MKKGNDKCYTCNTEFLPGSLFLFCPNCGARMPSEEEILLNRFAEQVKDSLESKWFKDLDSMSACCFAIDDLYETFVKEDDNG